MNLLKNNIARKLIASATTMAILASFSSGVFAASKNTNTNVIKNGSFESSTAFYGWAVKGTATKAKTTSLMPSTDGSYFALIGAENGQTTISQTITIPKNAVALSFDYKYITGSRTPSNTLDFCAATIDSNMYGEEVIMLTNIGDTMWGNNQWVNTTRNIKKYAGQTVTITFGVRDANDGIKSSATSMGVDNVVIITN